MSSNKNGMSRRDMLKGLVAGAVTGGVAVALGSEAEAKPGASREAKRPKVVVFGIDSANMEQILAWARQGLLPTFARLISQGAYGQFENIFRGMSVDAWAAYNTGVGPGQNNFFGSHPWQIHDRVAMQTTGVNRIFRLHAPTVPFMLAEAGVQVGLCGCAMTWPPERLRNGFMMSGKGAPGLGDGPECKGHVYHTQDGHRAAPSLRTKIAFSGGSCDTEIRYKNSAVPLRLRLDAQASTVAISYQGGGPDPAPG